MLKRTQKPVDYQLREETITDTDDIITLEQFLQIPRDKRDSIDFLFSYYGQKAVAKYESVNIKCPDADTVQRIKDRHVTVDDIFDMIHTTSIARFVPESATRLLNRYQSRIDGLGLDNTIEKARAYINGLDDSLKNNAAQRGFLRLAGYSYPFTEEKSQVSTRQLIALVFLALQDEEKRIGSLDHAKIQFVEALYEIQRGYNISKSGIDEGFRDKYIFPEGAFNKLIEKLDGIHPDCQVLYMTEETASLKLPIVVREEAMRYLAGFAASPDKTEALRLIAQVKKGGVEVIWDQIKNNIVTRLFNEFGSLYQGKTDPHFMALVKKGKETAISPVSIVSYPLIIQPLNKLKNKVCDLNDRGHSLAASKTNQLVQLMCNLNHDYFIEEKMSYDTYRKESLAIINQERPELDKHRGCKQILGNLLILICTLGTGQLLNKAWSGHFLFFRKTDSSKHIDQLTQLIEKIESPVRDTSIPVLLDTSSASIAPVPR